MSHPTPDPRLAEEAEKIVCEHMTVLMNADKFKATINAIATALAAAEIRGVRRAAEAVENSRDISRSKNSAFCRCTKDKNCPYCVGALSQYNVCLNAILSLIPPAEGGNE